jgi:hypothetical protein
MWRKWKFHQAIVTRLAIACSAVAISLALIALAVAARWDVRWGDLGTWLAGIGSLLAAVAAVGIAIHTDNKQKRKEEEERAESAARALRRARRIVLKNDRYRENHKPNGAGGTSRYTVTLQNTGSTSIYEIRWGRPFVVHANLLSDFDSSEMRPTLAWPKSAVLAHEPDVDVLQADPFGVGAERNKPLERMVAYHSLPIIASPISTKRASTSGGSIVNAKEAMKMIRSSWVC